MPLTRYLFLTLGDNPVWYRQATYAILTLLAHAPQPREILVVTDHPERYAWFGKSVRCHTPDAATVAAWKGPYGFFWRVDLCAMRLACDLEPVPARMVYLDCDVVVAKPLDDLLAQVDTGTCFFHLHEFDLATSRRAGDRKLHAALRGKRFAGLTIDGRAGMWNNGVTAIPVDRSGILDRAIAVLDAMHEAGVRSTFLAQLSLSLAVLEQGQPAEAQAWVQHYWSNKEGWNESISGLLADCCMRGLSPAQAVELVRQSPIQRPLAVKIRTWQKTLVRLAQLPQT